MKNKCIVVYTVKVDSSLIKECLKYLDFALEYTLKNNKGIGEVELIDVDVCKDCDNE